MFDVISPVSTKRCRRYALFIHERHNRSMCTQIKAAQHVSVEDNKHAMENLLNNISFFGIFLYFFFKNILLQCVSLIYIHLPCIITRGTFKLWLAIILYVIPYFKNLRNRSELSIAEEYDSVCISDCLLCLSFAQNSSMSR